MKKLITFMLAAFLTVGCLTVTTKAEEPVNIAASRTWKFAAFGQGVKKASNTTSGTIAGNNLRIVSNSGKIVPASTDGLAFYYTAFDADTENFTISADITVEEWTFSNGQEGFGLMVADAVASHGASAVFWNNSYMATITKVGFKWDTSKNEASLTTGSGYSMQLGVGAQEKIGATPANIATGNPIEYGFTSKMWPLDISPITNNLKAGTYNIVGNCTNLDSLSLKAETIEPLKTSFHLEIQRNNTGYFLTYTDASGNSRTQKFYHGSDGDELTKIDKDHVYAGFYASRNASILVQNVNINVVHPDDDAAAEERPVTYVTPSYKVISNQISNTEDYELVFYANADGTVSVEGPDGTVASNEKVTANTKKRFDVLLDKGSNQYTIVFKPDEDYKPDEYSLLSSYASKTFTHTVTYKAYEGDVIYVSPSGTSSGAGSKEEPMDIYTALICPAPGQRIYIMEGTYNLSATVKVERGINGTSSANIYLQADPEAQSRPVFDFSGKCSGMQFGGDYWNIKGFDVTKSSPGNTGIQVSGNYNVVEDVDTYRNGNTGIQISRMDSRDMFEDWPSYNLILNCTSYLNADPGYEDADGFAAKITCGEGNVFDGCIAAYNADDGWDLFAKIESGPIGSVTIKNSIAFKNGYDLDENNNEINAGNGNGFKMGGSGITGYHILENSIAFANKAKGIDSNSCPDIQVKNCTSFNNGASNVVFSTSGNANTDYSAEGVISFKDANGNTAGETISLKGNQDKNKVYRTSNYYFPDGNTNGVKAASNWFVNLDTDEAIHGGITRYADGNIRMNGYLELTGKAPEDAGARLAASSETLQGIWQAPDGKYYYYTDGVVNTAMDGLTYYQQWNNWIYLENGEWISTKSDIVDYNGGKFLVAHGVYVTNIHGLHYNAADNKWYFLSNGQVQNQVTDLVLYNGAWFYVVNGVKAEDCNGLIEYNGSKFYVAAGQVQTEHSGLSYNEGDQTWYFISGGQVQDQVTSLVYYDGAWFYVRNGVLAVGYTGNVEYDGATFYVENGMLVQ